MSFREKYNQLKREFDDLQKELKAKNDMLIETQSKLIALHVANDELMKVVLNQDDSNSDDVYYVAPF